MKHATNNKMTMLSVPICLLLSFSIFINACQAQVKKELAKEKASSPWAAPNKQLDKDPYFIENKDSITAYGPRGIIRNIIQDRNDNIWIASYTGIVRFKDGLFTNFTNIKGLRRYRIFSVFEDKAGTIWFGTVGAGVYKFDGTSFKNFTVSDGLVDNKVESITEDNVGNIWFGTGNGVSCYNGKEFRNFTVKDGLVDADVHAIIQNKLGRIWVGALGGVFYYDPTNPIKGEAAFTALHKNPAQAFRNIRSVIEDKNGTLWFGGQEGLFTYDGQTAKNINTNFTGNLYEDSKGNIWFSAGNGDKASNMSLNRFTIEATPLAYANSNSILIKKEDGQLFGITEDSKGNIWYGTLGGVCRYDGTSFNYFKK